MPYCENCGSTLAPTAKFCGNCGAAKAPKATSNVPAKAATKRERLNYYSPPTDRVVPSAPMPFFGPQPPQTYQPQPMTYQSPPQTQFPPAQPIYPQTSAVPSYQPPMQTQSPTGEVTVGVLLLRKTKSMGRWDTYAGVVTSQRMIFAQITSQMLTDAATQAREEAKAEGKGFFGQWGDQLRNTFGFTSRYLTMPPHAILAETPGNFALPNNTISGIDVHLHQHQRNNTNIHEFEIHIHSSNGTYSYHMDENSEFTDILKRVYGSLVHMPFGYFSRSVNIKL